MKIHFIKIFIKQAESDLDILQETIITRDEKKTSFVAHRMKSSFAAFGFDTGKDLAIEIEFNPAADKSQVVLNKLKKAVDGIITEFRKSYPD